jgi:hypothetical protein
MTRPARAGRPWLTATGSQRAQRAVPYLIQGRAWQPVEFVIDRSGHHDAAGVGRRDEVGDTVRPAESRLVQPPQMLGDRGVLSGFPQVFAHGSR